MKELTGLAKIPHAFYPHGKQAIYDRETTFDEASAINPIRSCGQDIHFIPRTAATMFSSLTSSVGIAGNAFSAEAEYLLVKISWDLLRRVCVLT